jgi:hypothetical protein
MIHCFVIKKRDGRIKARVVADACSQQWYVFLPSHDDQLGFHQWGESEISCSIK